MSSRKSQGDRKSDSAVIDPATRRDSSGRIAQRLFESKVLTIAVGKAKVVLNVYEEALKKTAFFRIEGAPATESEKVLRLKDTLRGFTSDKPVEIDSEDEERIKNESNTAALTTNTVIADYYLYNQDIEILRLGPFKKFLLFLYSLPPTTISSNSEAKVMLQAYCLARHYECTNIQNAIIDLFCLYHAETGVDFDGLLWMITWSGDNTASPLTVYLIEQIAYGIARISFEVFKRKNRSITEFIEIGNSHLRLNLFAAIARHAGNTDLSDPVTRPNVWHVLENQARGGKAESEPADDLVILG